MTSKYKAFKLSIVESPDRPVKTHFVAQIEVTGTQSILLLIPQFSEISRMANEISM